MWDKDKPDEDVNDPDPKNQINLYFAYNFNIKMTVIEIVLLKKNF